MSGLANFILPQQLENSDKLVGPWKLNMATYPYFILILLKSLFDDIWFSSFDMYVIAFPWMGFLFHHYVHIVSLHQ
jgi:hypothetical protein